MGKIAFFLIIVFIIIFPIFLSNKTYKNNLINHQKNKALIEIIDGKYKKYNHSLEINGSFKRADVFKKYYQFSDLYANDLIKNETYYAKKAIKKDNLIKAINVKYKNLDYTLNAFKVVYYEKKKFLKGWNFYFTTDKIRGEGKYFEIDKNKNLYAKNIIYYLKVKE
jgi:hypothetical protein